MSTTTQRVSGSGARVLRVMAALKGHSISGLSNGELAKALGESPATINRCLNTLIAEGVATRLENGRYALGVRMLQIAQAHSAEINRAKARIEALDQRVNAGAHL